MLLEKNAHPSATLYRVFPGGHHVGAIGPFAGRGEGKINESLIVPVHKQFMNVARLILGLALTFIFSLVGFAYIEPVIGHLLHPGVSPNNPLTSAEIVIDISLTCFLTILLGGIFGTLIAGPRNYKQSAGWIVGLCTFMEILILSGVAGITVGGSNPGLRVGSGITFAVGMIAAGAFAYIVVCFVLGRIYKRRVDEV